MGKPCDATKTLRSDWEFLGSVDHWMGKLFAIVPTLNTTKRGFAL